MAYTPPPLVPSAPVPGVLTGETSGTITTFDYSLHLNAIIKELNQLNYNLSSISTAEPGSVMAQLSLTNNNMRGSITKFTDLNSTLRTLASSLEKVNTTMNVQTTGLANISSTLTKQLIVSETATMDQVKNNQLTQAIAKQAQIDAGKEPVVITPEAFLTTLEQRVNDILSFRAITFAAGVVTSAIQDTITVAYTTSVSWAAQTKAGQWITTTYTETKQYLTTLFSADKIKEEVNDGINKAANALKNPGSSDSPPTP